MIHFRHSTHNTIEMSLNTLVQKQNEIETLAETVRKQFELLKKAVGDPLQGIHHV